VHPFFVVHFNGKSSTVSIRNTYRLVGVTEKKGMLPSERKKHRDPERPERQPSFLNNTPYNCNRKINVSTGISQEILQASY
jgi:hypothetical protein